MTACLTPEREAECRTLKAHDKREQEIKDNINEFWSNSKRYNQEISYIEKNSHVQEINLIIRPNYTSSLMKTAQALQIAQEFSKDEMSEFQHNVIKLEVLNWYKNHYILLKLSSCLLFAISTIGFIKELPKK